MSETQARSRRFGIGTVTALALIVVLGTGMAGFVQIGLMGPGGWPQAAGQVLAPWCSAAMLCALTVSIHAVVCRAVRCGIYMATTALPSSLMEACVRIERFRAKIF